MADEAAAKFRSWLEGQLTEIGADADVYTDYVEGILQDDDGPVEERVDAAVDVLSAAVEDEGVLDDLRKALVEKWNLRESGELAAAAAEAEAKAAKDKAAKAAELAELKALAEERKAAEHARHTKKLSRAEAKAREAMLSTYGFDTMDFDEDGNPIIPEGKTREVDPMAGVSVNDNKSKVKAKEKAQRDAHKKAHEDNQARIKKQQENEKRKKEKAKARTQKREKRRGTG